MKKLLVILFIALASCAAVEENSDDNVMLEKSIFSIKSKVPHIPKIHTPRTHLPKTHLPRTHVPKTHGPITHVPKTHGPITHVPKTHGPITHVPITHAPITHVPITHVPITHVPITHVPKTNILKTDRVKNLSEVKKIPVKGVNGLFGGKVGEVFRKLGDMVKKGIAWLKKNNLWNPIIEQLKGLGQKYGNELCEKALPPEVCGPAIDFALDHLLPSEQN